MADDDYYQIYNSPRRGYTERPGYDDRRDRRPPPPQDSYRDRYDDRYEQQRRGGGGDPYDRRDGDRDRYQSNSRRDDYPPRDEYRAHSQNDYSPSHSKPQGPPKQRGGGGGGGGGGDGYNPDLWKRKNRAEKYEVEAILKGFRAACLKRGTAGIKGFGRMFRQYDDNRDKKLAENEFRKGVREYGVSAADVTDSELSSLFRYFDKDDSGHINYEELLQGLRPPMNEGRKRLIARAFDKLDVTGDGYITVEDLIDKEGGYDVTHHPKFKSGEMTQKQVLEMFLANFEAPRSRDGKVTREEFIDYYAGVSASIDKDVYFDLMMRQSWRLDKPSSYTGKKAQAFAF